MNTRHLFALAGAWLCFALLLPQNGWAEGARQELHALYKQGDYLGCLSRAYRVAKEDVRSPVPLVYAALSVCHFEDRAIRSRVKSPLGKALVYLEEAKRRDPEGRQLQGFGRPLAWMQERMFEGAADAWFGGREDHRAFFDRMHALFPSREGIWRNVLHAGRYVEDLEYAFEDWDNPFFRLADMGLRYPGLGPEVRELIYLHNLCRMDPPRFERTFLRKYLENYRPSQGEEVYIASLQAYLRELPPRGYLRPGSDLARAAVSHSRDQSDHRAFEHHGSTGESFTERMNRFQIPASFRGENMHAGSERPLDCFFSLLIDHPVESLGHRYNMMNEHYRYIGVGISQQPENWKIWVFDFAVQSGDEGHSS